MHVLDGKVLLSSIPFPHSRRRQLLPTPGISLPMEGHQWAYCHQWAYTINGHTAPGFSPSLYSLCPGRRYNNLNGVWREEWGLGSPAPFSVSNEQPARTTVSFAPMQLTTELHLPNSGLVFRSQHTWRFKLHSLKSALSGKSESLTHVTLPLSLLFQDIQSAGRDNGAYLAHLKMPAPPPRNILASVSPSAPLAQ